MECLCLLLWWWLLLHIISNCASTFIEWTVFSLLNCVCSFVKNNWLYLYKPVCRLYIFHWFLYSFTNTIQFWLLYFLYVLEFNSVVCLCSLVLFWLVWVFCCKHSLKYFKYILEDKKIHRNETTCLNHTAFRWRRQHQMLASVAV